jgi:alanyl-tRNA synthetase
MTDRLYYTDPYLREFDATVVGVGERDGRALVTLDRTAFYPTSGGQPFDTGTLGGLRVVDVFDDDEGNVAHVIDAVRRPGPVDPPDPAGLAEARRAPERAEAEGPALQVGQSVHGAIDWPRRFDHMQQHTGQHVLSAAFERLFHVRTVSFHLGSDVSTIDLAREMATKEIAAAEDEANRIVWDDRDVKISFAGSEDAARMPLRKESKREGRLRLIDVDGFDLSACGGTHVLRTGVIGIIAIAGWERFKGGQRLEFLCGGRALARFRSLRDTAAAGMRLLSVSSDELPAAVERLQGDAKDQRRTIVGLQNELARYRAEELAASAEATGRGRLVLRTVDADAAGLKSLAMAVAERPGHAAVLVSTSTPALVVVSRAADITVDAGAVVRALTGRFGGRGGGKPELAQGGGLSGTTADILNAARAAITHS